MHDPPSDTEALRAAHDAVLERIATACSRSGRARHDVALVAVSKTVDAARLRDAVAVGITRLGENRVQEALAKVPDVPGATWELVGPLQSNKARRALEAFDRIQTVDSVGLAERLARMVDDIRPGDAFPVLVQVNIDDDPAKAGLAPDDVAPALAAMTALPGLRVEGLMTVGRLVGEAEHARPTFRALRELSDGLRRSGLALGPELSMGMTDDFEIAIEEGATIVRVGRAIFGERPHHHGDDRFEHQH
jgi:PLP dependent protein